MKYLYLLAFALLSSTTNAQELPSSDLYKRILTQDSLLFNVGFNTCDIRQFEVLLSEDFEFFHDKDSISDKPTFLRNLRNGLCGAPGEYQSRRALLAGSTQVFPLYKGKKLYAAIQHGIHQFYEKNKGQQETFASSARFTHLWLLENGQWRLHRSLSYDHQPNMAEPSKALVFDNDEKIAQWLQDKGVPTLGLGVIRGGQLQQVRVFGELQKGQAAPYNTLFNVASLTKPITAWVALRLVSQGKWNLDEPLHKYWTDPDVAKDERHKLLTTRIVLSHQTGFPNWRFNTKDEKLAFEFEPGNSYQYSGEGMEYLRRALERKFKKTLDQLAQELVFDPFKMSDTQFFWTAKTDSTRFSLGYSPEGKAYPFHKTKSASAADDLHTTIADYGRFLIGVLNAEGLSDKMAAEFKTPQVKTKAFKHFGLGFELYDLGKGEFALSHGGADKGVQTLFFLLPSTRDGLIIFTNVDDGYKVYEELLLHYLGERGKRLVDIEMGR